MTMHTDDWIKVLAQLHTPKPRFGFGVAIALMVLLSVMITALVLGLRPEIVHFTPTWPLELKTLLLLGVTILSGLELRNASLPLSQTRSLYGVWLFVAVCLGLVVHEWMSYPLQDILNQFLKENFPACLAAVTIYGTLGALGLTVLMRQYAPTKLVRTASLIGLTAAAAGALGYSLHCPFDSPTFIVVAYGLPVLIIALLCRKILPKFIAW